MDRPSTKRLYGMYLAGLRAYLTDEAAADFRLAHELGSEAVVNGLEILALARIHETTFEALIPPLTSAAEREQLAVRASVFFTEAILPIERTHTTAINTKIEIDQASDQLRQHNVALEESNREIHEEIAARHHAEAALKTYEKNGSEEQAESQKLEQQLQESVRRILCASEEERTKMSQVLQHEIAQALLGIKIRLLALQSDASANHLSLSQEINTTHWLVETTAKNLSRLIREFSEHHHPSTR